MKQQSRYEENINPLFKSEQYWGAAWCRHIDDYLNAPPRCGYWIESRFPMRTSVLEIAGGSCRDSRYLSGRGYRVVATDFDQKTLDYLKERFPDSQLEFRREDGFKFTLHDDQVELSFSNGFWVCFSSDNEVLKLIREQVRVTRKYVVSLVHNAENRKLIDQFREKSMADSLYDIRFFSKAELVTLINRSGIKYKSLSIEKFGGPVDRFLSHKILSATGFTKKICRYLVPRLYRLQPWSKVERLVLVMHLE